MNEHYDLIGELPRPGSPTLNSLIGEGIRFKTDRLALVRDPEGEEEGGVCVLLLSNKAIRKVGKMLLREVAKLSKLGGHSPNTLLHIGGDEDVDFIFKWMEKVYQNFAEEHRPIQAVLNEAERGMRMLMKQHSTVLQPVAGRSRHE